MNKVLRTVAGAATYTSHHFHRRHSCQHLGTTAPPLSLRLVVMKIAFLTNSQVPQLENTEEEAPEPLPFLVA